jgi:hypothetical protein
VTCPSGPNFIDRAEVFFYPPEGVYVTTYFVQMGCGFAVYNTVSIDLSSDGNDPTGDGKGENPPGRRTIDLAYCGFTLNSFDEPVYPGGPDGMPICGVALALGIPGDPDTYMHLMIEYEIDEEGNVVLIDPAVDCRDEQIVNVEVGKEISFGTEESFLPTNGQDVTYEWKFGDGTLSSGEEESTTHTYQQTGQYHMTLTLEHELLGMLKQGFVTVNVVEPQEGDIDGDDNGDETGDESGDEAGDDETETPTEDEPTDENDDVDDDTSDDKERISSKLYSLLKSLTERRPNMFPILISRILEILEK